MIENIKIVPFESRFAKDFKQLNLEWLQRFELFEPVDLQHLDTPQKSIIEQGGKILIAVNKDMVVGTCALINKGGKTVELAKLAVLTNARGNGIGRKLTVESIKQAKYMGAEKIILVSNKKLASAIRLYESLDFKHLPVPSGTKYATADVYMELRLI